MGDRDEKVFNITDEFCLFNGDILDFDAPIDSMKISKVNPYDNDFVQSCNEYNIGSKLKKYSEFLVADKCEIIDRVKDGTGYIYKNERDRYIFDNCKSLIKNAEQIEVYVYQKSGKDLQYYFDNPVDLENLLTKNKSISISDGINNLILYFINILIILRTEKIIHKDIKPGNIIVGDDLYNFPKNIKIIDLGFSFEYKSLPEFMLSQAIHLFGDDVVQRMNTDKIITDYEGVESGIRNTLSGEYEDAHDDFRERSENTNEYDTFAFDYYQNWDKKYGGYETIFNVITGVATPLYAAPEFDLRLRKGFLTPTIASLLCPDPSSFILELRRDIPQYVINNQYNINYTKLAELYLSDSEIDDGYFDVVKKGIIRTNFIKNLIEYNQEKNTKYNLFEYIYLLANGLTGSEPIIYKYDLYAFGLILRELVDVYTDALTKNLLYDPRKNRAKTKTKKVSKKKRTKRKTSISGGNMKTVKDNFRNLEEINYIITNMINDDCIYRWTLDDLMSYYRGEEIDTEKYIYIKGEYYLLSSEDVTRENIIRQFQMINPQISEYVKPKPESSQQSIDWDSIRTQLTESGLNKRKIGLTITKMKKKGLTSVDQL
tara:strand:+ start:1182 stop:2981 length:1800 start_codon:yes stop_codon:yes gene_type:complete